MDPFSAPAFGALAGPAQSLPPPPYGGSAEGFRFEDEDEDVVEVPSSSWVSSSQQKRKRGKVLHDVLEIDGDDEPSEVVIIEASAYDKNKQPMEYDNNFQKHFKNISPNNPTGSSTYHGSENILLDSMDGDADDYGDDYPDDYEYDDNEDDEMGAEEYLYDDDDDAVDNNFNLTAQFDDLDLPPGVEATVPWLQKPEKASKKVVIDVEALKNYNQFKRFDTVQDFSDHYYVQQKAIKGISTVQKPSKDWTKRIQYEWKILEKDLPETIFVRVYEERMDLLRAVIIGPAGTPYHDGLFFFDVLFPLSYPNTPPLVNYHSGGLRLNPNLYNCGKVCLSLLGTWSGKGCEKWSPGNSTMLQVLVSIQALVLNTKPYFNEPGYASSAGSVQGENKSLAYNEEAFLLSCKTMMYAMRRPPKNFECFVTGHFCERGRDILVACKAYMNGAQVGCVDGKGIQDVDEGDTSCSSTFRNSLKVVYEDLLMEFTVKGADCNEFLVQKVKAGLANAPDTTLRL